MANDQLKTTPCGRDGCGRNRACCRSDCPIVMIEAEHGGWYWEPQHNMPADIRQVLQKADSHTNEMTCAIKDALFLQKFMVDNCSYDHSIAFIESQDLDWIIGNINGFLDGGTPYAQVGSVKESYAATPLLSLWLAYFRYKLGDERISNLDDRWW